MFEIRQSAPGEIMMAGRLDATHCDAALKLLNEIAALRVIDLARLEYIASAGLRVILITQKRCKAQGAVQADQRDADNLRYFRYAGFDQILDISRAAI